MTPSLIYRINEVVRMLSVSRDTVYRLVKDKKLTMVKIGTRASGITADSLEQHLRRIGAV